MTPPPVYFLGPDGTFCHAATLAFFGEHVALASCPDIGAIFEALAAAPRASAVVPIENSIEGSVNLTLDALLESPALMMTGEVVVEIEQCLLGTGPLSQITEVHSHPHAHPQCRRWLRAHLPNAKWVSTGSTAGAAHAVAQWPHAAAIGSAFAAEKAGIQLLERSIQDRAQNATRFIVLGHKPAAATGFDKTSLVFGAPHRRGALHSTLGVFENEGINLSKIESRPMAGAAWQYVFFADLEGHQEDAPVATALKHLRRRGELLRLFGSYPRARLKPAAKNRPD